MPTLGVYPRNKEAYLKLVSFGKECLKICRAHKIEPIIHGSMGYLFYTKDDDINVNDIDFLVFELALDILAVEFFKQGWKCKVAPHKVKVLNDGSKITFHSSEYYLPNLSRSALAVDIGGEDFKILNLESLIKSYQMGINVAPDKAKDYSRKLAVLVRVKN